MNKGELVKQCIPIILCALGLFGCLYNVEEEDNCPSVFSDSASVAYTVTMPIEVDTLDNVFAPLEVGNVWVYEYTRTVGNAYDSDTWCGKATFKIIDITDSVVTFKINDHGPDYTENIEINDTSSYSDYYLSLLPTLLRKDSIHPCFKLDNGHYGFVIYDNIKNMNATYVSGIGAIYHYAFIDGPGEYGLLSFNGKSVNSEALYSECIAKRAVHLKNIGIIGCK